jgi:hemerythrin superfamily protein
MLKEDHQEVDALFKEAEKATPAKKDKIVQKICSALKVHAELEEEMFYPALREAGVENDLLDEADVEHQGIKRLVSELESMAPGEELYDAKVTVLMEYVKHHVKEEETEIFPDAKKADLDLNVLGEQMEVRKVELQGQMN